MNKQLEKIRKRLADCPIPMDAVADWDGSEHWEIQDPTSPASALSSSGDYWWLVLSELIEQDKRLGAVFDYACAYRPDVSYLLQLATLTNSSVLSCDALVCADCLVAVEPASSFCINRRDNIVRKLEDGLPADCILCPRCAKVRIIQFAERFESAQQAIQRHQEAIDKLQGWIREWQGDSLTSTEKAVRDAIEEWGQK